MRVWWYLVIYTNLVFGLWCYEKGYQHGEVQTLKAVYSYMREFESPTADNFLEGYHQ